METIENNKLIAKFMNFSNCIVLNENGRKYDFNLPESFELIKEVETTIESNWCEVLEYQDYCFTEELKFHKSWDWLMPVAHKIISEQFNEDCINQGFNLWDKVEPNLMDNIYDGFKSSLIDLHNAVVEFIKWYNENK